MSSPETRPPTSPRSLIVTCEPQWEEALQHEMTRTLGAYDTRILRAGWLHTHLPPALEPPYRLAFSRQVLPEPLSLVHPSISTMAAAVAEQIASQLDTHQGPWRWHVFHNRWTQPEIKTSNRDRAHNKARPTATITKQHPQNKARYPEAATTQHSHNKDRPTEHPAGSSPHHKARPTEEIEPHAHEQADTTSTKRCELLSQAVLDQLQPRYRRLAKRAHTRSEALWQPDEAFVQLALPSNAQGFLSILTPEQRQPWEPTISGWASGDVFVPPDREAPSRACQKLYEVALRFDRPIQQGQTCVDLGSSPGGWAWVALQQSASVIAIDRSPLRPDLMQHPKLTFIQGDAFAFVPARPVDWLLSDLIAFPPRLLELLRTWLEHRWCQHFCVTLKLRGREDDPILNDFYTMLSLYTDDFLIRRLKVNKNEATVLGSLPTLHNSSPS